ncbi:nitrate- and nitrite sensing domain-containing protein [Actinoallomurus sp. CA-142502]|uniref:sensor histidine kinase n=1 Tax=Actinoallomurus sp. CA-142502 TaxID=3239885 RepID=UPI003D8A3269
MSLSTLWAFAASITLGDGLNLRHVNTIQDHLGYPSGALGSALEQERRLSMVFLGSKSDSDRASMESGRLVTDRQAEQFRRLAVDKGTQNVISPQAREWTKEILQYLDNLPARRRQIDTRATNRSQIFTRYSSAISTINQLQASLATLSDPGVTKDAGTEVALARAREVLSQEDALLSGALAAGRLTFAEHVQFTKLVGTQHNLYNDVLPDLRSDDRALYQRIISTPEYARLESLENRFTDHMPMSPPKTTMGGMNGMGGANTTTSGAQITADTPVQWKTTVSSVITRFRGLELGATAAASDRAKPIANGIILRVALAGALGLVAVIASLVLSLWVGRSVIRELTGLRRAALDLANERLPGVIRRLRRGEEVDVAAEAPPLSFSTREIDQVGQAFNAARRTAIQGAVEEAALRRSISDVFLNLARRNQALLHRQLSLLDTMERRISEPDELDDLFRLDHLATRMRRHAEGLIILSGQAPGRGWRNPVPAVDVARAAAAEVEDYARVTVAAMPQVAIAGTAVADLIHLLAELIENATLYSPPDTTVQVTGQIVAHGFALEVEDRGLSMDPAALAEANEKLARPPDFDLSNSAQLGLFVVSRLAQRHSIQVTLRTSPYGGTTAIVLLPDGIVVRSGEQGELEPGGRLAMTRRGEDALVPIGAIGPPSFGDRGSGPETGPMPLNGGGERPPLPQRHNGTPPGFNPSSLSTPSYDAGGSSNGSRPAPQDTGSFGTPSFGSAANHFDTGPADPYETDRRGTGHDPAPYETNAFDSGHPESSSFGGGGYAPGDSGYGSDTGQWNLPSTTEDTGGRPALPRRHSEPSAPSAPSAPGPAAGQRRSLFEPAGEPQADPADPSGPATEQPPAPASPGDAPSGSGKPSLPRRVRQASLAPQLREEAEPISETASDERSPEELRTMLSSIQKGWLRGRSDAEDTATGHEEEDI